MKTGIKKLDLQGLVTLALFVAMDVVLGKISFGSLTLKAGLGFIGSALLAYYFGPLWGGIGALVSDLLRSAIFGVELFSYIKNQLSGGVLLLQPY